MAYALRALLAAFACGAAAPAVSAPLVRCESADGKVTYANEGCPPGTQFRREVKKAEPVDPADARRARERARDDAERVESIEQQRRREEEKAAQARAAAAKKEEARRSECRKLTASVQDAERDLERSTLAKRAEAEQRLKRARESYDKSCRES
jgi:multidrug resistance efflux pump